MLGEIIDKRVNDPVLIKPRINLNFNEDHFYSKEPKTPTASTQPQQQANNLPQSPPSVNTPSPDLESGSQTQLLIQETPQLRPKTDNNSGN